MLQSLGLQRIVHDLVTEQQPVKSLRHQLRLMWHVCEQAVFQVLATKSLESQRVLQLLIYRDILLLERAITTPPEVINTLLTVHI